MRSAKSIIFLILIFCLLSIIGSLLLSNASANAVRNDIYEAVFRYNIEHNYYATHTPVKSFYLVIGSSDEYKGPKRWIRKLLHLRLDKLKDPSDGLLFRFNNHKPPVRRFSECSIDVLSNISDKRTNALGALIRAGDIRWKNPHLVEVRCDYIECDILNSFDLYRLKHTNGKWNVISEERAWP